MTLAPGLRLGCYEVTELLGVGGMGEVYRARDTKLNRDVAVKVLPEAFIQDPERTARFTREAQVLASLNHPNIGGVYGFEDTGSMHAIVMELVEGPTLADLLATPPRALTLDQCLPIARQIADALEAAHEHGIVHRDLKPANIKVREDGVVKVLDFGLAKPGEAHGSGLRSQADLTHSPTITSPAMVTGVGMILGTAAYMSPEQAKGKPADKRSDVWAFGAVLYEMLAGRRAFDGEDVSDTLAAVLRGEPDWSALPAAIPDHIRLLVRRCLERDRQKRVSDIGVARFVLNEPLPSGTTPLQVAPSSARSRFWKRGAIAAGLLLTGALGSIAGRYTRPADAPKPVTRFTYELAEGLRFTNPGRHVVTISPDGTRMAFVAALQLFIKAMQDENASPLRGTASQGVGGVTSPVFSPDGQSLAFWSEQEIRTIGVGGGTPRTIARGIQNPMGMRWDGDRIVIGQVNKGAIAIPVDGGTPELLVAAQSNEIIFGPQILPGGQTVIFTTAATPNDWDTSRVVAQTIGSTERKVVLERGSDARYLRSGHLIYALGGVIYATRFDPVRAEVVGVAQPVLEGVARANGNQTGVTQLAVSDDGSVVYVSGPSSGYIGLTDMASVDRRGNVVSLKLPPMLYYAPRFSPSGLQIAVGASEKTQENIWIHDATGKTAIRQLTSGGNNRFPVWTPDGQYVTFQSDREGDQALYWQREDGSRSAERLTRPGASEVHFADGWLPDGNRLVVSVRGPRGYTLHMFNRTTNTLTALGAETFSALPHVAVSPDGRWMALQRGSDNSPSIVVQSIPPTESRHLIGQGVGPFWSADGKSLYWANLNALNFWRVDVTTEPTFRVGARPEPIDRPAPAGGGANAPRQYDIAPTDDHIVLVVTSETENLTARPRVNVILNWLEEVKARVPAN